MTATVVLFVICLFSWITREQTKLGQGSRPLELERVCEMYASMSETLSPLCVLEMNESLTQKQ